MLTHAERCIERGTIVGCPDRCTGVFMRQCLALLLLVFALPAAAQIYKYTDASGNTAYSNQPPNGTKAETVELPPLNSVETVVPAAPPPLPATQTQSQTQIPHSAAA